MVETKSLEQTQKNWEGSHGRVPQAYSDGVRASTGWQQKAIEGEELYAAKLQESIASKRRARRIAEISDEQWKKAALDKGAQRIATGMAASKDKYATGMGKVLDVIRGVNLAPRTSDPMANVDGRVKPLVAALAAMKDRS